MGEESDVLWHERKGPAKPEAAWVRLGQFAYDAQYMQAPVSREGNLIKLDWMNASYRSIPARFDSIVLSRPPTEISSSVWAEYRFSAAFFVVLRPHHAHSHGVDVDGLVTASATRFKLIPIPSSFTLGVFTNPPIDLLNCRPQFISNCLFGATLFLVDSS
jgi:hypothetical protein